MGQFAGLRVSGPISVYSRDLPKMVIDEKWFNKIESRMFTIRLRICAFLVPWIYRTNTYTYLYDVPF